jgi:radical SAM protein with 4Fe4S-binding SPASM domain
MKNGSIAFHGGEPFLAPVEDMRKVWLECKDLWPTVQWTTTTNLVYKLTDEIRSFMKEAFTHGFATSWDKGIRFDNDKQEDLWKQNIKTLREDGHAITLMVSLNRQITDMDPYDFIALIEDLGIEYLHLERITPNGNALLNDNIMPSNVELDDWLLRLWHATVETKCYEKFLNIFFNGILTSYATSTYIGCRCRSCEQKIFTLNADGTIGGCPNSAVSNTFGRITDKIETLLTSSGRVDNIACETHRDSRCYECEVYDVCNGDCHQLAWQEDVCAAPKSFMKFIKHENDLDLYKQVLDGNIGVEQ